MVDLRSLVPKWHDDAACRDIDEVTEQAFFFEPNATTTDPQTQSPSMLLSFLYCRDCPVREPCLRAGLEPIVIPGLVKEGPSGRDMILVDETPRTMGTWGGTVEFDRNMTRHLDMEERVRGLQATFDRRLAGRIEAWQERRTSTRPMGRALAINAHIDAMLGIDVTPLPARTCAACDQELPRMRKDAIYCSGRCRVRALRVRREGGSGGQPERVRRPSFASSSPEGA